MKYGEIQEMPTSISRELVDSDKTCRGFHESLLRSYHILQKVKFLLSRSTPPDVVLELVELMETRTWHNGRIAGLHEAADLPLGKPEHEEESGTAANLRTSIKRRCVELSR